MEFRDLKKQYQVLKKEIETEISDVCKSSHFISGQQVKELEEQLAEYVGVKHCISCANGTDALSLALTAWGIGIGDVVFVPDFTFFSSGECPAVLGATSIFVDVEEDTFNINPDALESAIEEILVKGKYRPRVVVTVDLFGQPADYTRIKPICDKYNLLLLEDGAQGFGGSINGKMACSFGDISATSFFPAKPLGCYGDGGAVFTDNDEWASLIRSYAVHGKSEESKYDNIRLGMNSRLDTLQAAILQVKFKAFKERELDQVNQVARWYEEALRDCGLVTPIVKENIVSSWAQYTIQLPDDCNRQIIQEKLKVQGIPAMVYYMKPMHTQGAFKESDSAIADCPVTEKLCRRVLSLPMGPYMTKEDTELVSKTLKYYIKR